MLSSAKGLKRYFAFALMALTLGLLTVGDAESDTLPKGWAEDGLIKFRALRNGAPLGVVMLKFDINKDKYTVETQTLFDYRVGPFTLYYYALRARDEWEGNRLLRAEGLVNDDGKLFQVKGSTEADSFRFEGGEGELVAPLETSVPSTYWNKALTQATKLIDLQYGRLREIAVTETGPEQIESKGRLVDAVRYEMRGELDLDIWYDNRGEWVRMAFTHSDSEIEYVRVEPRPGDAERFFDLESVRDIEAAGVRDVLKTLE